MVIEVVPQMERVFQVSCVSFGGSVISGSMRDPLNQNLSQLMSVDNQQLLMRGADNYSATAMRTGGENGDLFSCSASTVGSSHTANISLSGKHSTRHVFQVIPRKMCSDTATYTCYV